MGAELESPEAVDRALLLRLQNGDIDALGELYDLHRLVVYRTALVITRNDAAAEDILQDAFLRLHRYCHRVDPERPLRPWLYRVTVNLSYTHLRRGMRIINSIEDWIDRFVSGPAHAPESVASKEESRVVLDKALANLSTQQRTALVLFYLNGLSLEEVSEVMERPVNTVKATLHFARNNLRKKLKGQDLLASFDTDMDFRYENSSL